MFAIIYIAFHFAMLSVAGEGRTQPQDSRESCDVILKTELVLRTVTNNLFTILNFKGVKEKPKLKNYTLLHNFLVAQTLKDHYVLKTIGEISKVDKNSFDNATASFIGLVNEILDADSNNIKNNEDNENSTLATCIIQNLVNYLDNYFATLIEIQISYPTFRSIGNKLNPEIIKILENKNSSISPTVGAQNVSQDFITKNNNEFNDEVPANETFTGNCTEDEILPDINPFWEPEKSAEELSGRRIFGGRRTKAKHYPFVASIAIFGRFQCGGSILSADIIITAASCIQLAHNNRFYRENPSFLAVRIGSNFFNDGGELVPVLEVYFHPVYNPKTLKNNLALLRLQRAIKFTSKKSRKKVKRIDIDDKAHPLPSNSPRITIVGWGATSRTNLLKKPWLNMLRYVELDYYSFEDCQEIYTKEHITRQNFCAGFISKGDGACNNDVGGPGVISGILTGVISFASPTCGTPDAPTVFTKVGYYADWIETIMQAPEKKRISPKRKFTTTMTEHTFPTHQSPTTTFWLRPLDRHETGPSQTVSVYHEFDQKEKVKKQFSIFRQFLKVMFDSEEVDSFLQNAKVKKTGLREGTTDEDIPDDFKPVIEISSTQPMSKPNQVENTDEVNVAQQEVNFPLMNEQLLKNILHQMQEVQTKPSQYESQIVDYSQDIPPLKLHDFADIQNEAHHHKKRHKGNKHREKSKHLPHTTELYVGSEEYFEEVMNYDEQSEYYNSMDQDHKHKLRFGDDLIKEHQKYKSMKHKGDQSNEQSIPTFSEPNEKEVPSDGDTMNSKASNLFTNIFRNETLSSTEYEEQLLKVMSGNETSKTRVTALFMLNVNRPMTFETPEYLRNVDKHTALQIPEFTQISDTPTTIADQTFMSNVNISTQALDLEALSNTNKFTAMPSDEGKKIGRMNVDMDKVAKEFNDIDEYIKNYSLNDSNLPYFSKSENKHTTRPVNDKEHDDIYVFDQNEVTDSLSVSDEKTQLTETLPLNELMPTIDDKDLPPFEDVNDLKMYQELYASAFNVDGVGYVDNYNFKDVYFDAISEVLNQEEL